MGRHKSDYNNALIPDSEGKVRTDLSYIEKAVLYYEYVSGRCDYKSAYEAIHPEDGIVDDLNHRYYPWFRHRTTKKFLKDVENERKVVEQKLMEKGARKYRSLKFNNEDEDSQSDSSKARLLASGEGVVDFRDKKSFIDWLNKQVNLIDDDKQRLDYLKMMSDLMRYKEDSNKGTEDIMRFYTPMQCRECSLYKEREEELLADGRIKDGIYVGDYAN